MMEILRSLQNDDKMSVGRMTQEPIMKTQCHCGEFSGELPGIPRAEEVSEIPISNLEDNWELLKVIPPPTLP